jgi:hypothetical protein
METDMEKETETDNTQTWTRTLSHTWTWNWGTYAMYFIRRNCPYLAPYGLPLKYHGAIYILEAPLHYENNDMQI